MLDHWYAIKHKPEPKSNWMGPSLVTIESDRILWSGGPSYMPVHDWEKEIQIVKDYGEIDDMEYGAVEQVMDQFTLDFPPETKLETSGGWLAPNGKFYPCAFMDHLNTAQDLAFVHYQEQGDGAQRIEKEGWAKIYGDGICLLPSSYMYGETGEYTKAQLDTLGDLFVLATNEEDELYAKHIKEELDREKDFGGRF